VTSLTTNSKEEKKKVIEIPLPKNLELADAQNSECNEKGNFCGVWCKDYHVCVHLLLKKNPNSEDKMDLFEIVPCSKSKSKEIKVNE
jgi:hypothetical protein